MDAQELITVSNILAKHAFGGYRNWIPTTGVNGEIVIAASNGDTGRSLRPEQASREAWLIVEALQRSPASKPESLPPLEWRKQVDKQIEAVEFTRNCHNDRFFRDEKQLQDHDYRITAWGECLSDALKKIVTQDERIAKLEADIDRIVKLGCGIESEQEGFQGRIAKLEQAIKDERENGINFACDVGQDCCDYENRLAKLQKEKASSAYVAAIDASEQASHAIAIEEFAKIKSRLDKVESAAFGLGWLPAKIGMLESAIVEAVADSVELSTFDALEQRTTAIESRLNFQNSVTFKVIDSEHEKLNSRIDKTVETETHDVLERRVTAIESRLAKAYLAGRI